MSNREFKVGDLVAYDIDSPYVGVDEWKCVGIVIPHDWKTLSEEERKREIKELGQTRVYWFVQNFYHHSPRVVEIAGVLVHLTKQELSRREEKEKENKRRKYAKMVG